MSKRVLIVDDSKIVHTQMKKLLKDTEFEIVGCCQSGECAIQAYEEYKPDVVTMDIVMPGMDGLEATKEILAKWPDAKIVIASSLAHDDTIEEAGKIGTQGFVYKPFEKEELLEALRNATK